MNQVFAAGVDISTALPWGSGTISSQYPTVNTLVNILLKNSLTVISVLLLVILVYGGLQLIMGAGNDDPKKAAAAKAMVTDAIIGFVVVFLAYTIITIIEKITGLPILHSAL